MLWIVVYIVAGVVGLVLVMALVGLMLPRDHIAARSTTLAKSPEEVWRALTNLDAQTTWRRGLRRIEHVDAMRFREHSTHGAILFEVVEDRANERRITRIADDKLPFGGRWIYELRPAAGGTHLTITEDGFIKNPVFRFLSKTVFPAASTIEKFLKDLAAHLDTAIVISPADPAT